MGGVILYDGVCALCAFVVQFVVRRDSARFFQFAALQSAVAQPLLARHGISEAEALQSLVVLTPEGAALRRSDAALYIGSQLHFPLPALAYLGSFLPRTLRDWLYNRVAASRYAWFGKLSGPMAATQDTLSRFLDREEVCEGLEPEQRAELERESRKGR